MIKEGDFPERYITQDNGENYWFIVKMPNGSYWAGHYEPRGIKFSKDFHELSEAKTYVANLCSLKLQILN